jgi:hypothetical protein
MTVVGNLVHTKARRHEGTRTIDGAFAAFLKGPEVYEHPEGQVGQTKILQKALPHFFVASWLRVSTPIRRDLVHTKARRHEGLGAIDDAFAAFLKGSGPEVDEHPEGQVEQTKIGEDLL